MQTLIYALRFQTTKANAYPLLEYIGRRPGARALLTEAEWEEIAELIRVAFGHTETVPWNRSASRDGIPL